MVANSFVLAGSCLHYRAGVAMCAGNTLPSFSACLTPTWQMRSRHDVLNPNLLDPILTTRIPYAFSSTESYATIRWRRRTQRW